MNAVDVVYCMLTVQFAAAAIRSLGHGVLRSSGWRGRVDDLLHTAMALAMAVMPWNWGRMLWEAPLTAFFAAAAVWFPLSAVSRCKKPRLTTMARRLPCAVSMAAMAWMTRSMVGPSQEPLADGLPAAHPDVHLGHSAGDAKAGNVVTGVLALYLIVCALRSLTRDMPTLGGAADGAAASPSAREAYDHFWAGSMALGTAIMLHMHH
ncbi:DUF5134 domain-containing protein [Streptomyces sp. NPDC002076]